MKKLIIKAVAVISFVALPIAGAQAGAGNHHAAVFGGATVTSASEDPTLALEYEYRTPLWDKKIGIGLVAERIFSDKAANLLIAGIVIHPWQGLKANVSFGQKFVSSKTKNVFRVGAGYDFHYNNISYGPVYNLDRVQGKYAHVIGIAVGLGF